MYQDEIIAEVWKNRDAYAAAHHHDLAEIVADIQARQGKRGRKLVDRRKLLKPSNQSCRPASGACFFSLRFGENQIVAPYLISIML